ncbi:hypothetical protein P9112_011471 [Eukaryota sp. TZLM1-RC]
MCNSYPIELFVEPLLMSLDINENFRDSKYEKQRADVFMPSFDDDLNVVDVVTVGVCKKNVLKDAQSELSPPDDSELCKRKTYANTLKELKHFRRVNYQILEYLRSGSPDQSKQLFLELVDYIYQQNNHIRFENIIAGYLLNLRIIDDLMLTAAKFIMIVFLNS